MDNQETGATAGEAEEGLSNAVAAESNRWVFPEFDDEFETKTGEGRFTQS